MDILNNLNTVITKIYESIDDKIYTLLDKILIIDENILKKPPLSNIVDVYPNSIYVLTTSIVIMLVVCFTLRKIIAMYSGEIKTYTYKFLLKLIIVSALASSSVYICDTILNINGLITEIIISMGQDITDNEISFESLSECVKQLQDNASKDFVSLDGIIKGFMGFGSITLLLNLSTRYVITILLIVVFPVIIMFMVGESSRYIFYSWVRMFIVNIFTQHLIAMLLIIPIASNTVDENMFKIILVGTIYVLYKINNYTIELFSNIKLGREV